MLWGDIHRKLAKVKNHVLHSLEDWRLGINTMPEKNSEYDPSDWKTLRYVFARLKKSEKAVFLDIGCGKGRPLLVAAEQGFQSCIGVEIDPTLAAIAQKNAEVFLRTQKAAQIRVLVGDIAEIDLPEADYFFLFNPFGENVMKKFLEKAVSSARKAKKEKFLIYRAAVHHEDVLTFPEIQEFDLGLGKSYRSYRFYRISA